MKLNWQYVQLESVLKPICREEAINSGQEYSLLGAHWYGQGLYIKGIKSGYEIQAKRLFLVRAGDFVYNRLFAWKGSFALAGKEVDGCYVSNEFPCFVIDTNRLDGKFLSWYFQRENMWTESLSLSAGATSTSRNRLKEALFLKMQIPLPPLAEQKRIVAKIGQLFIKIREARTLRDKAAEEIEALFATKLRSTMLAYGNATKLIPFTEIVKLQRRPVTVQLDKGYREIGVYCFGSGIFHKPARSGAEVGDKELFEIYAGDLILQITFAWEGAVALAETSDHGLFGSVRYLTFRVEENICSPRYLLTYMKTPEAIAELGRISPGSAGRNRVLNVKRLKEILIPVVPLRAQAWLTDALQAEVDAFKRLQAETAVELDALLPSILDLAFKGEL